MRQIKFRAKNAEGVWVEGSLVIDKYQRTDGKQFDVAFIASGLPCMESPGDMWTAKMQRVKPETIGQDTSLRDKFGKPIFEGDILRHPYVDPIFRDLVESKDGEGVTSEVVFRDGAFVVKYDIDDFIYLDGFTRNGNAEVVGNIHDNPGLIKKL